LSLAVALHRATPYLIGIAMGVVVKEFGKVQLPKGAIVSGWVASLTGIIWCYYKPSNLSHKDYQYDPTSAAQYSALAPLIWSLGIAWIIFACYNDASWKINSLLSSRLMIFISRISYSIYLTVFIVFFYFIGTLKSSEEFHVTSYLDRMETCTVVFVAVIFTLTVDIPTQNIVRHLLSFKLTKKCEIGKEKNHQNNHQNGKTEATIHEEEEEEEIDDVFGSNDDDAYVYKPMKTKYSNDDENSG
jgi:peptidoglycan/LPS O-acetylase OafA/YrhL